MAASIHQLLIEYGTIMLFLNVLLVQLGLPIPAVPLLVLAGGLAAAGQLNPVNIIVSGVTASTLADYAWYLAGRRMGPKILVRLGLISSSPGLASRQVPTNYAAWRGSLLLFGKFVPGLATLAPPLAGMMGMRCHMFLLYAGTGGLLWVCTFVALGYAFAPDAAVVLTLLEAFGHYAMLATAAMLVAYILLRLVQRRG